MPDHWWSVHVLDGVAPVLEVLASQALPQCFLQHSGGRVAGGIFSIRVHRLKGLLVRQTDKLKGNLKTKIILSSVQYFYNKSTFIQYSDTAYDTKISVDRIVCGLTELCDDWKLWISLPRDLWRNNTFGQYTFSEIRLGDAFSQQKILWNLNPTIWRTHASPCTSWQFGCQADCPCSAARSWRRGHRCLGRPLGRPSPKQSCCLR